MKELIEDIKARISYQELKIEDLYDYIKENSNLKNILNAEIKAKKEHLNDLKILLKNIQAQESKTFDPCECGFDVDYYDNEEIRYTKRNKKTSTSITYDKDYQTYFISNYIFNNPAFLYEVKNIKIPNHRFGVELLRNLGVIE